MSSHRGLVDVPEGKVWWKVTAPAQPQPDRNLLFIHAGITDHTLWDEQVAEFVAQGWTCLVIDNFGFGNSHPSQEFLSKDPRPALDVNAHLAAVVEAALPKDSQRVIVVCVSMGGQSGLEFALNRPDMVRGLAVSGGGVRDFDCLIPDAEMQLFERLEQLTEAKDIEGMAHWHARFWGHGPYRLNQFTEDGWQHCNPALRDKLVAWNRDICAREVKNEGGMIFKSKGDNVIERLKNMQMPTAVAIGKYDETATNNGMRMIADKIPGATMTEFPAAHLPMAEIPKEFNSWLEKFLKNNFRV